jgi:excinuclease ABC subunit A
MVTRLDNIEIKGARVHNLRNIDVLIPRNKLTVITGLSGSGKSSLAFDTLYAEGQRRYVESLSAYARQFLGRMSKPEVDYIRGIAPAIAIEQKVNTRNPRSTVGTSTEIYEYLKLLFARVGRTFSPVSGEEVRKQRVSDVSDYILGLEEGARVLLLSPLPVRSDRSVSEQLQVLLQQGFSRVFDGKDVIQIEDILLDVNLDVHKGLLLVIDRLINDGSDSLSSRLGDSAEAAFFEGHGTCFVAQAFDEGYQMHEFSNRYELDGLSFEEPSVNLFSFNNPYGACKRCEGFGSVIGIDEELVIPDKSLSVYDEAIACWRGEKMSEWKDALVMNAHKFSFPIHKPIFELGEEQRRLLWTGNQYFEGLNAFFEYVESQAYKIQYRVMLSRYRGKTICPECRGTRLRKDAFFVKVGEQDLGSLVLMPVSDLADFFASIELNAHDQKVAGRLLTEIRQRISYLIDVGLGYLTLNRASSTLSGGESQRINLATSLGSSLVGSMYILDEPSIGLHPRDTGRLITVLKKLRDLGNTVIVVEHDEEIMKAADHIIDMGPGAGMNGGQVVFEGQLDQLLSHDSLTGQYLSRRLRIPAPATPRPWKEYLDLGGARENNLKNLNVRFPLNTLTVVAGVSGSGKTSLVRNVLYGAVKRFLGGNTETSGRFDRLGGDINRLSHVELVDQNPIGRSTRSNPVTYIKAYDDIRTLYSDLPLSKSRLYKPGYFSFNVKGGRCEECEGEGIVRIEMQFMADIYLTCESCGGKRFKDDVLDVKFNSRNITELLEMTIDEAIAFFKSAPGKENLVDRIIQKLEVLSEVGLGYLHMGQSSSTLSGGEAQRVKLAYFLTRGESDQATLFIFDEPTTGLHFHDIHKLYQSLRKLIDKGHSILVIEHNLELIRSADWVIELGPEGGKGGGNLIFAGVPSDLANADTHTGQCLAQQ